MHATVTYHSLTEGLLKVEVSTDAATHSALSACPTLWEDILADVRFRLSTLNLNPPQ